MPSATPSTRKQREHTPKSRREFLKRTALFTGGILAFGHSLLSRPLQSALAAPIPKSAGIRYALDLEGQLAGPISSLESGFISGQASDQIQAHTLYPKKHLATIAYEDIAIECGHTMSPAFYLWIQQALAGQTPQRNGGILTTNMGNQIIDRKIFSGAALTEVAFPALDRAANTPASVGIKIRPGQVSYQAGSGQIGFPPAGKRGPWLVSNFRINIEGLEQACAQVVRVEPLIWKQSVSQGQIGTRRSELSTPGPIQTPNLILTVPQSQAGPFTQWFYQFVVQGQASDNEERSGTLEFLATDLQTILFTLNFGHLGIFRMSPVSQSQNSPVPLVTVEMYCETVQLSQFPNA